MWAKNVMKERMWEVVARGIFVMPCLHTMDARLLVLMIWVRLGSVLDRNVVRGKC